MLPRRGIRVLTQVSDGGALRIHESTTTQAIGRLPAYDPGKHWSARVPCERRIARSLMPLWSSGPN